MKIFYLVRKQLLFFTKLISFIFLIIEHSELSWWQMPAVDFYFYIHYTYTSLHTIQTQINKKINYIKNLSSPAPTNAMDFIKLSHEK